MKKNINIIRTLKEILKKETNLFSKGFTLTEMLVVVMVIAVLAAIAYPLYTKAATKSRAIEAINLLEMVRNKQLQKYAEDRVYYSSFTNMGQLTANKRQETLSAQELKIKDYTLSLNNVHSCMTAKYEKGNTTFSFSSSYEQTGLGCTGDVCSSFGNIVGTAKDVCNCGSKSCSNGYTLNEDTCNCDCYLGCDQGGTCFAPYGGGLTRACATGCGTQNSTSSCGGSVWSGSCWSPSQTQPTSQTCGNSGTQTRTCTANCTGGSCGSWGACTGQTCPSSSKPSTTQSCGNCGTQTRTVTCNTNTGNWVTGTFGTCTGAGVCAAGTTQSCGVGGTQTCSSSCAWGTCGGQACPSSTKPSTSEACTNCGTKTRSVTCNTSTYTWTSGAWSACSGTKSDSAACDSGTGTKTRTCTNDVWGAWDTSSCTVNCDTSTKPATSEECTNCGTKTRTVTCNTSTGTWSSGAWGSCSGTKTESAACDSGTGSKTRTCTNDVWGAWDTSACTVSCDTSTKPAESQTCGNCGTQTRTVTCNTSTGTWSSGSWSTCTGAGECAAGATDSTSCDSGYSGSKTRTCSSSCTWGTWNTSSCSTSCANGYCSSNGTCIVATSTCSLGQTTTFPTTAPCYDHGTPTWTCTANSCPYGWTVTCACDTGYMGTNCSSCATGYCYNGSACVSGERISDGQTCKKDCTSTKPATSQGCGNCGSQTRTVTCDETTGNWSAGSWGTCTGTGVCAAGATQSCGGGGYGTQTCSSSCAWGNCALDCSITAVKAANKLVCCTMQPPDSVCFTPVYEWVLTYTFLESNGSHYYCGNQCPQTTTCDGSCSTSGAICKEGDLITDCYGSEVAECLSEYKEYTCKVVDYIQNY